MKTTLTIQESAELIKRGVSPERASYDSCATSVGSIIRTPIQPIFTLADLLSLLPKEVIADTRFCKNETCPINIRWDYTMGIWFVVYELVSLPDGIGEDSELINALFSTLIWAIDHNHVKLD